MTKPELAPLPMPLERKEDEALAAYQEALLNAMAAPELTADEIARRLADDARATPFREYVATFDLRCIEVTSKLMRRWGERKPR
jgi:hypothetical protein